MLLPVKLHKMAAVARCLVFSLTATVDKVTLCPLGGLHGAVCASLETVTEDKSTLCPVTGLGNRCDLSSNHVSSLGHCGSVISGMISVLSVYLRS